MKRFALVLMLTLAVSAHAGVKDPIEGDAYRTWIAAQDVELQAYLQSACRTPFDSIQVTGPLDPLYDGPDDAKALFHSVRVIAESHRPDCMEGWEYYRAEPRMTPVAGFRGAIAEVSLEGVRKTVLFLTPQENRWLVWVRDVHAAGVTDVTSVEFGDYAAAVSKYLSDIEDTAAPNATLMGLPEAADFYAPKPDYVIQGYDNYMDHLHAHEEVNTPFAHGILGFVPGDSLLEAMKESPPQKAWPNKEEPLLQHEYRKYFERGGDTSELRTLSADVVQTLKPGEYFFCVGLDGEVRFGYEIPREEVDRVERETGKKVPRANHAFLFPGEPVLTAGAFFVEAGPKGPEIVEVNAHSGHYFYSNVTATIREDIAVRSDEYLMTLGHFFAALDRLGIPYDRILVSKM